MVADYNRRVTEHNRKAQAHNRKVIEDLNRQLRSGSAPVRYSTPEQTLADRVHEAVGRLDPREYHVFLSYARIDGAEVAQTLRDHLEALGSPCGSTGGDRARTQSVPADGHRAPDGQGRYRTADSGVPRWSLLDRA